MKPAAGGSVPAVPEAASRVFPAERLPLVARYAELLATDGVVRGLMGPREAPRMWDRHLLNCGLLAGAFPAGSSVADVGSGAGLPGLVLGLARTDLRITLVEPLLRRTSFLEEVVAELGLDHVTVVRARAEALHGETVFDVVTARAVAPLERLLVWCMPLVAGEGSLVAMKGASAEAEVESAGPILARLGCSAPAVEELGIPDDAGAVPQTRIVRVTWSDPSRVSWPASGGLPSAGAAPAARRTSRSSGARTARGGSRRQRRGAP